MGLGIGRVDPVRHARPGRGIVVPSTDPELGDELVLVRGHFDSYHGGTGAADNGCRLCHHLRPQILTRRRFG